jgi:CDP-diglyceride synthetase
MLLVSFFGMIFGAVLFSVYYGHYHSKDAKANIKYATIFAALITVASGLVFYQMYLFSSADSLPCNGIPWQFGFLRASIFMASAPVVAYMIGKARGKRHVVSRFFFHKR